MTRINEQMEEYMIKYEWKHIVLRAEEFTS